MVYKVPESKKSLKQNQFEFQIESDPDEGRTYSLPLMKYLKPTVARRLAGADPANAMGILFDEYIGPDLIEKFEDMEQVEGLMTALQEASGVNLGESQASTDS